MRQTFPYVGCDCHQISTNVVRIVSLEELVRYCRPFLSVGCCVAHILRFSGMSLEAVSFQIIAIMDISI